MVFSYLVTLVRDDGNTNDDALGKLVDHLVNAGVHGLTPLGSTGEFACLNWQQRQQVVEVVLEANGGRVPVIAGIAATTTADAYGGLHGFNNDNGKKFLVHLFAAAA